MGGRVRRTVAGRGVLVAGALVAGALVAVALVSCDEGGSSPYSVEKPTHPAMTSPVGHAAGSGSGHAEHAGLAHLPDGHPAIPPGGAGGDPPAPSPPPVGGPVEVLGVRFDGPEGWVAERATGMRRAQFRLPAVPGDRYDGALTVIPASGSVQQNVARWEGQFQRRPQAEVESMNVDGLDVHVVFIVEGTFLHKDRPMAPGPGEPRSGYQLYGAVVQAPGGQLFFKAWGPRATMEKGRASFDEMIRSLRRVR
ncbi:MAG: hypothetical protein O7J95_12060 [Planctomycetota bacterium]|nr:hypothetical protein [Planctomycetota bacterium]